MIMEGSAGHELMELTNSKATEPFEWEMDCWQCPISLQANEGTCLFLDTSGGEVQGIVWYTKYSTNI
jgi:hypothetical protein